MPNTQNPYESPTFGNALSLRVDGAIGAMSLSPNGRDAVLAGRKGLYIIDLDDPFTPPRWLRHITSWEVADVQWSPHGGAKPSWCVSTSNQKALLWDLARPATNAIQSVLHRHTRAITDVHFHPQHPEMLATCSIDTFVFTWDMRAPRRPVNKHAEWRAGATQVKWRSGHPHQLVSSHHHSFYLWDARKGALPVVRVENAHAGKINGLDFGGDRLVTCSNDASVKFWDAAALLEVSPKPAVVLHTAYPVARARRLPFGNDPCCGIMPVRGGDNAIHVVNLAGAFRRACSLGETVSTDAVPDYSFRGHSGPVKDFLWRTQHAKYDGFDGKRSWREHQLVTWSPRDCDLKLWPHERGIYDAAGYNPQHEELLGAMVGGTPEERSDGVRGSSPGDDLGNGFDEGSFEKAFDEGSFKDAWTVDKREESGDYPPASTDRNTRGNSGGTTREDPRDPCYASYIAEPATTFADFSKDTSGDLLSRLAAHAIKKTHSSLGHSQLNHLNWISGVRMGRSGPSAKKIREGEDAEDIDDLTQPEEGPANLGEEISIVGHKFSKLRFEKISVSTGEIEISLRGPLPSVADSVDEAVESTRGEKRDSVSEAGNVSAITTRPPETAANASFADAAEQKLIFIRLEIKFPKSYPFLEPVSLKTSSKKHRHKRPNHISFDVEETHELNAAVKRDLIKNLDAIAQFYANKYNRYCLEPCLRYLMGEKIDLDDALMASEMGQDALGISDSDAEIGNENWVDDLIDQHEAAAAFAKEMTVSGDDDDEDDADLIYANNDHLSTSRELARQADNAGQGKTDNSGSSRVKHDSTPLPKGCGAVWTNTGELVCFFIPKGSDVNMSSKAEHRFGHAAGEGTMEARANRLYRPSNARVSDRMRNTNNSENSDSEAEQNAESDSDTFSIASERSSSSEDSFSSDWDEMLQEEVSSRSRMPDMFRGTIALGRHIGTNRDVSGLPVSMKSSAYRSSAVDDTGSKSTKKSRKGKRAQSVVSIIDFKHLIPDKFELACEYRVLGEAPDMIARHNSEVAYNYGYAELGQVWRLIEMILTKKLSLRELTEVGKDFFNTHSGTSRDFFWGNHPLGHSWLVGELFAHFEKKRDLQMLAMLSCLLFENLSNVRTSEARALEIPIHTPYPSLPPRPSIVSMREQGLLSSEEAVFSEARSVKNEDSLSRKASALSQREIQMSRPLSPEGRAPHESPSLSTSLRFASPVSHRSESPSFADNIFMGQALERNSRSFETSNPNAKAFSKLSAPGRSKNRGIQPKQRAPLVQREKVRPPPSLVMEIKNADSLDLYENRFSALLLGEIDQDKLYNYREQYAEMLYTWGLPMHRIKILKFNYHSQDPDSAKNTQYNAHEVAFGSRYRRALSNKQSLICAITPIETAKENAWNTKSRNEIQYCSYCGLIVAKRVVICTKCEHIVHSHCAAEWWTPEDADEGTAECPTGCGCMCLVVEREYR